MDRAEQTTAADAPSRWCGLSDSEPTMISPETLGALILEVEEDCSTQFCHELHDGLSQLLMALQAHLQVHDLASRSGKAEKADEELAKSRECLNQAVRECRRLVSSQAADERDLGSSLETLMRESGARWNWAEADFHDLRPAEACATEGPPERLMHLLCRRLVSAFRRKSGIRACMDLRIEEAPQPALCATFTVTGDSLSALPFTSETSSTTEAILKRTQGLAEALGGILRRDMHAPAEQRIAIVLPAGEPRPGTSYAASRGSKVAQHDV